MDEYDKAEYDRERVDEDKLHNRLDEVEAYRARKKMREGRYGGIDEDTLFDQPELPPGITREIEWEATKDPEEEIMWDQED
jgi:hypothetical protein